MSVSVTGKYLGDKKTEITHGPSGAMLRTAAPLDNQGDGSTFSPTDLVACALASCLATMLGIYAERNGLNLEGAWFKADKTMTAEPPRRIAALTVEIHLPAALPAERRAALERAATGGCPVGRSLAPQIEEQISFAYDV